MIKRMEFFHVGLGGAEIAVNVIDMLNIKIASPYLEIIMFCITLCFSGTFRKVVKQISPVLYSNASRSFFLLIFFLVIFTGPATAGADAKGIQYVILLDTSESMTWDSRLINKPDQSGHKILLFDQVKHDTLQLIEGIPKSQSAEIHFMPFDKKIHDVQTFRLTSGERREDTRLQIQRYLADLKATGQQTYIFSAIQRVINKFHPRGDEPKKNMVTTIFVLSDGVSTEPNYPATLHSALDLFQNWVNSSADKPWLYTLHILPDNLSKSDREKLAMEKDAFKSIPQAKMITSTIGEKTRLRIINMRIPELDFGYWFPGDKRPERQISFDYITSGTEKENIVLTFSPVFKREQNVLRPGMDVVLPHIQTTTIANGSGTYVTTLRLKPTLVNPIPNADFIIEGSLDIKTDERILLKQKNICWRLHVGRPPAIFLEPFQRPERPKSILISGSLPKQVSRIFRVQKNGKISGNVESINVTSTLDKKNLFPGKPKLQLADQDGFNSGIWKITNWASADYARITIPLNQNLDAGRYKGKVIGRISDRTTFQFLEPDSTNLKNQILLPFDLTITTPPEPYWKAVTKRMAGLALIFATAGAIYWWRRPTFQDIELQLIEADSPEDFDSGRGKDNLTLHGKKPISVGLQSGRLEEFGTNIVFRPERHDRRHVLWVRQIGEKPVKHYQREKGSAYWHEQDHTTSDFQVTNGDILACNDLAIRIFSVSYNDESDEITNY